MIRSISTLAAIACVLSTGSRALGTSIYRLGGQVTDGLALFPQANPQGIPYEQYGAPLGGFPVDFIARLTLEDPATDQWRFQFTVFDGDRAESFVVNPPDPRAFEPAPFINNVEVSNGHIAIEFQDTPVPFEEFALNIDVAAQSGSWQWRRDCPVCDLQFPLPSASAIVSSVQAIPEPYTVVLACIAAILAPHLATARPQSQTGSTTARSFRSGDR